MPSRAIAVVEDPARLAALAGTENFPVALRLLPRRHRAHLAAVYAAARLIDDVGDATDMAPTDRMAALDDLESDLDRVFSGAAPCRPALRPLVETARECSLPKQLFRDLVEANRRDQQTGRYASYAELAGYCELSANPIGRMVLEVFGVDDPQLGVLSDQVCTALQILEHCQDIGEDKQLRDRIYLPLDDMQAFGVQPDDLDDAQTSAQLRRLVAFEVSRASTLLVFGRALVARLHGWARLAVAGYVAGGMATVDAIRRANYDVLRVTPRPRKRDIVRHATALMARAR